LPGFEDAGTTPDAGGLDPNRVRFTTTYDPATEVFTSIVDARDAIPAAIDLDIGAQVEFTDAAWELGFTRFHVRARGGVSGSGDVRVAALEGTTFDAVTQAPADGFLVDAADGEDGNEFDDTVIGTQKQWFAYDVGSHTLSPKPYVYVVKSDAGAYFKLELVSFYDLHETYGSEGESAVYTIKWASIDAPPDTTDAGSP